MASIYWAYVNTLNTLVKGTEYEKKNLEEIVRHAPVGPLFNNAGQVLNHTLYFEQFRPVGLKARQCRKASWTRPSGLHSGSFDEFKGENGGSLHRFIRFGLGVVGAKRKGRIGYRTMS